MQIYLASQRPGIVPGKQRERIAAETGGDRRSECAVVGKTDRRIKRAQRLGHILIKRRPRRARDGQNVSADFDERDIHIVRPENHADRAVCRRGVVIDVDVEHAHFTFRSQSEIEI